MAKRRKPKSKDQVRTFYKRGGFSAFDKACRLFFNKLSLLKNYDSLSVKEKRYMFSNKVILAKPTAARFQQISSKELQKLGDCIQKKIRVYSFESNKEWFSPYEVQLFWLLGNLINSNMITANRKKALIEMFGTKTLEANTFIPHFFLAILKSAMSLSSIDTKYYCIDVRMAAVVPGNPEVEMSVMLHIHSARKKHIEINNIYRPAFSIGLPNLDQEMDWLKVKASFLKGAYRGPNDELMVYMQSHARKRMGERLDLVDSSSIYYTIWMNTTDMDKFILYKGYLLFPYELHKCRVGYLVADIIDDLLVFKTFLFITHSSTPEGDKLKEISGLAWKDISYWKIDRLSTFLKTDTEKYPGLTAMFKEAGLGDLFHLKGLDFDIDSLQDVNLDALRDYIYKGKQEVSVEFA